MVCKYRCFMSLLSWRSTKAECFTHYCLLEKWSVTWGFRELVRCIVGPRYFYKTRLSRNIFKVFSSSHLCFVYFCDPAIIPKISGKASRHSPLLTKKRGCKAKTKQTKQQQQKCLFRVFGTVTGRHRIHRIPKCGLNCE